MTKKYLIIGDLKLEDKYGQFFLKLLSKAGINESDCCFNELPDDNTVIILLGEDSLVKFLGMSGIEARRGSIYKFSQNYVIPTFHPRSVAKGGGVTRWYSIAIVHDLQLAIKVYNKEELPLHPRLEVVKNVNQLYDFFSKIPTDSLCAFDIETSMCAGEWIRCIGFSHDPSFGVVVPFEDNNTDYLDWIKCLSTCMTSKKIRWVGQNGYNFDIPFIKRVWGFEVGGYFADSMILHHMLYPEFPHDLGTISSFYTTIPYYKDTSEENLFQYNCNDAVATLIATTKMLEEAKERGFESLYRNYYHPLILTLGKLAQKGMRIDKEYQHQLRSNLKSEIKSLQTELDTIYQRYTSTGYLKTKRRRFECLQQAGRKSIRLPNKKKAKWTTRRVDSQIKKLTELITKKESLNVRSTKDLAHFLYITLDLPSKTKDGRLTTDETAINQLYLKTKHPFLKTMLELRNRRNMLSRWGMLKTSSEGLITTNYAFTDTGRLRSGRMEAK